MKWDVFVKITIDDDLLEDPDLQSVAYYSLKDLDELILGRLDRKSIHQISGVVKAECTGIIRRNS